jgi:hypothetical protein
LHFLWQQGFLQELCGIHGSGDISYLREVLKDLLGYIDHNCSFKEGKVLWYEPYCCYSPAKQTKLLHLWDEIGLPHEKQKQKYGPTLHIIGFTVDLNGMHVSMDDQDQTKPLCHISEFKMTMLGEPIDHCENSNSWLVG